MPLLNMTKNTNFAKKLLAEYRIGKTIGEGAFSKVKVAYHRKTNEKVAIKIISKKRLASSYRKKEREKRDREKRDELKRQERERKAAEEGVPPPPPPELTEAQKKQKEEEERRTAEKEAEMLEHMPGMFSTTLSKEVRLLQILSHPNIIRLYQVIETEDDFYIVMQYAGGGEIIDHIARKERLPENEARKYFRQIISAIDHCHLCGVLHRDLKLENILLSSDKDILISDFGLGRSFQEDNLCATFCGTPLYAAPELVSGIKYFGPPADVWAMGVVLYAMVCGKPPFQAETMSELYKRIKTVDFDFPRHCSPAFKDLIRRIFVKNTSTRITMDDLRTHEWACEGYDGPPERYIPTDEQRRLIGEGSDKIDNCKSIAFDHNAIMYVFHDIAPNTKLDKEKEKYLEKIEKKKQQRGLELVPSQANMDFIDSYQEPPRTLLRRNSQLSAPAIGAAASDTRLLLKSLDQFGSVPDMAQRHLAMPLVEDEPIGPLPDTPSITLASPPPTHQDEMADWANDPTTPVSRDHSSDRLPALNPAAIPVRRHSSAAVFRPQASAPSGLLAPTTSAPLDPRKVAEATAAAAEAAAAAAAAGPAELPKRRASVATIIRRASFASSSSETNLPSRKSSTMAEPGVMGTKSMPRSVRGIFNLVATSSRMDPKELMGEVVRVLTMLNIMHCVQDDWTVVAMYTSSYERVELELEVVKVWLLSMHGIRIRRLSGSSWLYKQLHSSISDRLNVTP